MVYHLPPAVSTRLQEGGTQVLLEVAQAGEGIEQGDNLIWMATTAAAIEALQPSQGRVVLF